MALKSMKMPKEAMEETEAEMDLDALGEELDMGEMPADLADEEMDLEATSDMDMISDDDLIAEIKKRGLSLDSEEKEEEEEDEDMVALEDMELAEEV